eukprot:752207-Hanusia_phi.AAC.1
MQKTQRYLERLEGLAVSKDGGLVVTEGQRVSLIDQEGWITFLAGCEEEGVEDGVGEQAKFNSPVGIVESSAGDFYLRPGESLHREGHSEGRGDDGGWQWRGRTQGRQGQGRPAPSPNGPVHGSWRWCNLR